MLQWTRRLRRGFNSCIIGGCATLIRIVRQQHDCNIMKRLFSSPDGAAIGLVRSRLEAAGIECEMRNEHLSPAMLGTPFDPELWVLRDSQFAEASNSWPLGVRHHHSRWRPIERWTGGRTRQSNETRDCKLVPGPISLARRQ